MMCCLPTLCLNPCCPSRFPLARPEPLRQRASGDRPGTKEAPAPDVVSQHVPCGFEAGASPEEPALVDDEDIHGLLNEALEQVSVELSASEGSQRVLRPDS